MSKQWLVASSALCRPSKSGTCYGHKSISYRTSLLRALYGEDTMANRAGDPSPRGYTLPCSDWEPATTMFDQQAE